MTRRISASRPVTGSSRPSRASAMRSRPYFSWASYADSGMAEITRWLPRTLVSTPRTASRVAPYSLSSRPAAVAEPSSTSASSRCSTDVLVLEPLRLALRGVQHAAQPLRDEHLAGCRTRAADLGTAGQLPLRVPTQGRNVGVRAGKELGHESVGLVEQRQQQVPGVDLRVPEAQRRGLSVVQRLLRPLGQPVGVHARVPPSRVASNSSMRASRSSTSPIAA
jgi:hypothetical protein